MAELHKETLKKVLGEIPFTAELYWLLRQRSKPLQTQYTLHDLPNFFPELCNQAKACREKAKAGKNVFLFGSTHYWNEYSAVLALSLYAKGHSVTFGYIAKSDYRTPINRFDLRRQSIYTGNALKPAQTLINPINLSGLNPNLSLPDEVIEGIRKVTIFDVQYISQVEDVDVESPLYKLRWEANLDAARGLYPLLQKLKPDVAIIPNGSILETGAANIITQFLKIKTVTYEFGEQQERIWMANNDEVMHQNTNALWQAKQKEKLTKSQWDKVKELYAARMQGVKWENFSRMWQGVGTVGSKEVRAQLNLDDRPVVLLATNVIGDSLTLGRNLFSHTMTEFVLRTVQYFAGRPEVQFIIRIHPGETYLKGVSLAETIRQDMPKLPDNIIIVGAKEKINTYDLITLADLGIVFTTTVGLEMALAGVPVVIGGQTHYRNRGFSYDPDSWVNYFKMLGKLLHNVKENRLTKIQVDDAWHYAYSFFFEFPRPMPWHLMHMGRDFREHPISYVCSAEGEKKYGDTFRYLTGDPIDWEKI
jgi:hypothetical protein